MIELYDRIVLKRDLPEKDLRHGDVGTVVMIYEEDEGYEIEFYTLEGSTYRVETLPSSYIRPVRKNEVTHVRETV